MKYLLLVLGVLASVAGIGTRAEAQNYPWCAYYSGRGGGGTNCGFVSFEQCMASASGLGSDCRQNTQYVPPAGPRTSPRHARHTSHKNS
jgi:hypothetical protein